MMWCLFLLTLISAGLTHADFADLDSKPDRPPVKKEQSIFDVITDVNKKRGLGRTGEKQQDLFQGDIALSAADLRAVGLGRTAPTDNIVLTWPRKLWRTRVIPYVIQDYYRNSVEWKAMIAAMREIESKTCLKYRPKSYNDKAWILIHKGQGCFSYIGRSTAFGPTKVSLPPHCLKSKGLIMHELIHAIGFFHEQARRDRDNYVRILTQNIQARNLYNFDKARKDYVDTFGLPYDYKSIMHYTRTTWTKNGKNTMEAKNDPNVELGGLQITKYDIAKINTMYHCHEKKGAIWTEWSDWSQCIKNWRGCYRSKHRICLAENLKLCPGADEYGVHSVPQKCPTPAHCEIERIDGFWSQWSSWTSCTKRCDKGTKKRSRSCASPRPSGGGRNCKGPSTDTEVCIRQKCRKSALDSNFEDGMGMWTNVKTYKDPGDWKRGRGRVNYESGPSTDHTDGRGWYLYVPSRPGRHYEKATIVSRTLRGQKCISFAYCMNGKNMGKLAIFAQDDTKQWYIFPFHKKGHQGKGWHHAQATAGSPAWKGRTYKFYFEATTGISPYSDIALDDIFIENGDCDKINNQKPNKPSVSHGCNNKVKDCVWWAKRGECHLNPAFMTTSCCLACRGMGDCNSKEYSKECRFWARHGECKKNPVWMWGKCCKACKAQGKCENKNRKCADWAKSEECKKNPIWMWGNCCPACFDESKCVDKNPKCKEWAKQDTNECVRNREWMESNCCISCKAAEG